MVGAHAGDIPGTKNLPKRSTMDVYELVRGPFATHRSFGDVPDATFTFPKEQPESE